MKTIMLVFGTRPEAIKMAPLVKEFKKYPHIFKTLVCVTGQHRRMLDQVLSLFDIIPDYDLNIMQPSQDLYDITSKVLLGMRDVFEKVKPDLVFVHGDTSTSMTAAVAAFYQQIPVAHIEAGLRTYNMKSPWPEEMNRSVTGRIASWHFAATPCAKQNLLRENIDEKLVIVTGNTVIDALQWIICKINNNHGITAEIDALIAKEGYDVRRLNSQRRLILITGHRRENFGDGFQNICHAIKYLSMANPDVDFVYPVHLNPNVQTPAQEILGNKSANNNLFLLNPLDYLPFIYLMSKSYLLLTDSGGLQEEAPGLGKPVLVMRDTTERPEALEAGTVQLVGTGRENIEKAVTALLDDKELYFEMSSAINPYGDGKASERIVEFISNLICPHDS